MKKTKLISILSTFSKEEMKKFEKFIASPFFNNGRNFIPYFKILKTYYPEFDSQDITVEKLFQILYPGKSFDKKSAVTMRVLESQIAGLAVEFLRYNNDSKGFNKIFSQINFLSELKIRKLDSLFNSSYKSLEKLIESETDSEQDRYKLREKLLSEKNDFLLDRDRQKETSENLHLQSKYFTYSIITDILKLKLDLDVNQSVFNTDFKIDLFREFINNLDLKNIMEYIKLNSSEFHAVSAIYYNCLMAKTDVNNETYYKDFKDLLFNNIQLFSRAEKHTLFNHMISCCWRQNRHGNLKVNLNSNKELFELHKYLLENNMYKNDNTGFIELVFFRNIVMNALNAREIDWLENFLNKYVDELAPEQRKNMYNYGMAIVCFERNEFEKSLEFISAVEYEYFYFKVDVKTWQLRIYYELNLFEQVTSLVDTFKHFLSKNKSLSPEFRKPIDEFLKYYIQLFKIKNGDDSFSLKQIESEVSNIPNLSHKGWILRKIIELEKTAAKK